MSRFIHFIIIGIAFSLLVSCQSTGGNRGMVRHLAVEKRGSGLIYWEAIPAADSKISIIDEEGAVKARREKLDPDKKLLSQAFKMAGGSLLYEKRDVLPSDVEVFLPTEEISKRYGDHPEFLAKGLKIKPEMIVSSPGLAGQFSHVVVESAEKKCVVFFGYGENSNLQKSKAEPIRHYEAVTGSLCESQGVAAAVTLEKDVLQLLSRILFDDGEYTRKQLLAKAFKKLDRLEELREEEITKDTVAPVITIADEVAIARAEAVVTGRITDDSEIDMVRIADTWIELNDDGSFSTQVPLVAGIKQLTLIAIDQYGNSSERAITLPAVPAVEEAAPEKAGSFSAILIGNSEYKHWRDLDTPHYDVKGLSLVLRAQYGFDIEKIIVNGSYKNILQVLEGVRNQVTGEDNLLIYFSGHGVLHRGKGYWVPVDGYLDDPEKWIPNSEINRALRRIPAKHVIVIADSCYSGTLAQQKIDKIEHVRLATRSRTAMSAGSGEEVVLEPVLAEGEEDNSVFAKKLIAVLQKNKDDARGAYDVFNEVKSLLTMYPQSPQYGALSGIGHEVGGDFIFIRK